MDHDQRFEAAGTRGVNRTRHQFLAGAAFSMHQHGAVRGRYRADRLLELLQAWTASDDIFQRITAGGIALEGKILTAQGKGVQSAGDGHADLFHQSGTLMDILKCPGIDGVNGGFIIFDGSDQNHRGFRRRFARVTQHFDAVVVWHFDIANNDVIQSAAELLDGCVTRGNGLDAVAFFA